MSGRFGSALAVALACGCASRQAVTAPAVRAAPAQEPAVPVSGALAASPEATAPPAPPSAPQDTTFETAVKPILVESCMPCHFPGGKMYARLPFDEPAVVRSHPEGVLRRLKDPEKRQTVERWIAATP